MAPEILANIKPTSELTLTEGLIPFIRRTGNVHVYSTAGKPPFSWVTEQEMANIAEMHLQFEQMILFGERREVNRKYYAGGIWSDQIEGSTGGSV